MKKIVITDRYDTDFEDPRANSIFDKDHQEICKPKSDYLFPLEFVISGLSQQPDEGRARIRGTGGKT